jgi:ribosomal protein S18 acetylase RimI-like enzyme
MQELDRDQNAFGNLGLRPATSQDEPFLRNLFASTRTNELALMNLDEKQKEFFIDMQFCAQTSQYAMSYPDATNSVIELDNVPVGRLILDEGESEYTLVDIALLPGNRGFGIGTHLVAELLREAAVARKSVKLSVWHSNPAKKLYERMGFATANGEGVYSEMWWKPI